MRARILHIICRREPIKIKKIHIPFLKQIPPVIVVSFDNCPGEKSRGDFLKKAAKSVTLFEFFSILYMSPNEG